MKFWNFVCRLLGAWGTLHIYKCDVFVSVVLSSAIFLPMWLLGCWVYAVFSYVFIYILTCNLAFFHTSWHIHLSFFFIPCHLLPFHLSFLSVMLHLHIRMVVLFVIFCILWTIKFTLILEQIFRGKKKCYSIGLPDEGAF
jgi:hypothetical protein